MKLFVHQPQDKSKPILTSGNFLKTCEHLRRAMRVTAGARFNASKRLSDHDKRLNITIAILSFLVIIMTIFQVTFEVEHAFDRIITLYNIFLSIGVLVIALVQFASSDAVHAEQHHKCALEIDELRRELDVIMVEPNIAEVKQIVAKYSSVLSNSNLNHSDDDMLLYVSTRPDLGFNLGFWEIAGVRIRSLIKAKAPYLVTLILAISTAGFVVFASQHLKA